MSPATRWARAKAKIVSAIALALWLWPSGPALANGRPLTLYLSYLPEISNWGPTDASGQAVVSMSEAVVALNLQGLPHVDMQHYEVWLVTPDLATWISMGRFQASSDTMSVRLMAADPVPLQDYRYLVITVEPATGDVPPPSGRNSIAGIFPNSEIVLQRQTTGNTTQPPSSSGSGAISSVPTVAPPVYLPETGTGQQAAATLSLGFLLMASLAVSLLRSRRI